MSCGGHMLSGFTCGSRRFDKYKFTTDKPSNPVLHQENKNKLSELLRIREEQDKGIFQTLPVFSSTTVPLTTVPLTTVPLTTVPLTTVKPIVSVFDDVSSLAYYPISDVTHKCKKD